MLVVEVVDNIDLLLITLADMKAKKQIKDFDVNWRDMRRVYVWGKSEKQEYWLGNQFRKTFGARCWRVEST